MTHDDLRQIRAVIREELGPLKADVATLKTDVARLERGQTALSDQIQDVVRELGGDLPDEPRAEAVG